LTPINDYGSGPSPVLQGALRSFDTLPYCRSQANASPAGGSPIADITALASVDLGGWIKLKTGHPHLQRRHAAIRARPSAKT
jgi:hypothetical protein